MSHCWIRSTYSVLIESLLDSFSFALSLVTFTVFHTHSFLPLLGFCGIMCVSLSLTFAHCVDSLALSSVTYTVFHTRSFSTPFLGSACGIMCVSLSLTSAHCLETLALWVPHRTVCLLLTLSHLVLLWQLRAAPSGCNPWLLWTRLVWAFVGLRLLSDNLL